MEPIKILLVEDDPGHARLIERNLRRGGITNEIVPVDNGQGAIDYLEGACTYGDHKNLIVLLDLNLPVIDGYQVLQRIKSNPRMKKLPVIILTTTDVPLEVERCYELGCNIFVTKPVRYDDFCSAVHNLGLLISTATIP
ncbi:MAG: response regulator [Negativicutes bacterium]|nr:response regulator [Negativicutes bacterium]